jgi:hypothetical protein
VEREARLGIKLECGVKDLAVLGYIREHGSSLSGTVLREVGLRWKIDGQ